MATRKKQGRRPKGDGSIYPRKEGGKVVGYQVAITINGQYLRRNAHDRDAAEAILAGLQELKRRDIDVGSGSQPLSQWMSAWLVLKSRNLRPKSAADYRHQIMTYILPGLGDIALSALRAHHIQAWIDRLVEDIRAGGRGNGTRTARVCATRLRQALDLAVDRKLILDNPMRGVVLPKDKPKKAEPLDDADVTKLIRGAQYDPLGGLWLAYVLLGLRKGEGLGLTWACIDWDARTLTVRGQVQTMQGIKSATPYRARKPEERSRRVFGPPKSDAGERTLPIPDILYDRLRRHYTAYLARKVKRADTWDEQGYVFTHRDGAPLWARWVSRQWDGFKERHGIRANCTIHNLRHTFASLYDETSAGTEALKMDMMGHEKKTVTQRYTASRIAAMRRAAEAIAAHVTPPEQEERRA